MVFWFSLKTITKPSHFQHTVLVWFWSIFSSVTPLLSILSLFRSPKASFGRYEALFRYSECEMSLVAFLIWNSVISFFQFQINGGMRITPNVGAILIEQEWSQDWWFLGDWVWARKNSQRGFHVVYNCLYKWTYCSNNLSRMGQSV